MQKFLIQYFDTVFVTAILCFSTFVLTLMLSSQDNSVMMWQTLAVGSLIITLATLLRYMYYHYWVQVMYSPVNKNELENIREVVEASSELVAISGASPFELIEFYNTQLISALMSCPRSHMTLYIDQTQETVARFRDRQADLVEAGKSDTTEKDS